MRDVSGTTSIARRFGDYLDCATFRGLPRLRDVSGTTSIARRFGDYLDCFISTSSNSPLRRIRASNGAYSRLWTSHQCPGYLREEITLTSDVLKSAIISHEYPNQSELCSVCGQLVQYQEARYRENEVNPELMRIPQILVSSPKRDMGLPGSDWPGPSLASQVRFFSS